MSLVVELDASRTESPGAQRQPHINVVLVGGAAAIQTEVIAGYVVRVWCGGRCGTFRSEEFGPEQRQKPWRSQMRSLLALCIFICFILSIVVT